MIGVKTSDKPSAWLSLTTCFATATPFPELFKLSKKMPIVAAGEKLSSINTSANLIDLCGIKGLGLD